MHLSLYGTTYRFGRLAYDIQGRRVDREDSSGGRCRCRITPCRLSGVGAHALLDQRGWRTLPVEVAEEKREVGANSEEVK